MLSSLHNELKKRLKNIRNFWTTYRNMIGMIKGNHSLMVNELVNCY